jgi:hypothetical protein
MVLAGRYMNPPDKATGVVASEKSAGVSTIMVAYKFA